MELKGKIQLKLQINVIFFPLLNNITDISVWNFQLTDYYYI